MDFSLGLALGELQISFVLSSGCQFSVIGAARMFYSVVLWSSCREE